jgi:hypothetical protein
MNTTLTALIVFGCLIGAVLLGRILRRLASAPHSPVKSAFYVTNLTTAHYVKLHAMLTDHSPLDVALFTDRAATGKWLGVPLEALMVQR